MRRGFFAQYGNRVAARRGGAAVVVKNTLSGNLSLSLRLAMTREAIADFFSREHHLHKARLARLYEQQSILGRDLDGEHLLLGVGEYGHILRATSTKARKELGNMLI